MIHQGSVPAQFGRDLRFHPTGPGQDREREAMRLLASDANTRLGPAKLAALGPLLVDGGDGAGQLHIRSAPPPGFGGAGFRFVPPSRTGRSLDATLDDLLRRADDFVAAREPIATLATRAAEDARRLLAPLGDEPSPPRLLAVGVAMDDGPRLSLDIETLGPDLRPGRVDIPVHGDVPSSALTPVIERHSPRVALRRRLDRIGASCLIDGATLSILAAVGGDPADVAERMRDRGAITFTFTGPEGRLYDGTCRWVEGSILTTLVEPDHPIRFDGDELTLCETNLPATTVIALEGRPLNALAEFPWLPGDAMIEGVTENGDWLYLRIRCAAFALTPAGVVPFDDM